MSIPRRALLTGATGFLGRRILRELVRGGWSVRCAVRPASDIQSLIEFFGDGWSLASRQIEILPGNLADAGFCREITDGIDCIFHAAASLTGSVSSLVSNTVVPTRTLFAVAADQKVGRAVLVSSLGVYGPQKLRCGSVLDETCPLDEFPARRDGYTYSKTLQEEVARTISADRGLPLVVIRPGVIYGDERGVLSHRIALPLGSLLLRMGGHQQVPLTYVDNCAAAIVQAGQANGIDGETVNLIDDDLPTGCDVIRRYRRSGHRLRTIGVPRWAILWLARFNEWYSRTSDDQIPAVLTRHRVNAMWKPLRYSNERARRLLDWTPRISLDEAFQRTLQSTTSSSTR
ncbi:NAD-dependent epimerase/dehydratase family protein [bacterium]|nr:NAD-dependent epimerase/dehydratase family protein [bacterium]